jgi:hypothetical protein
MTASSATPFPLSLADAAMSECVQIGTILFDAVRAHCRELGIREGDVVRRVSETSWQVVLTTSTGAYVSLDRVFARFVEARPCAGAPPLRILRS